MPKVSKLKLEPHRIIEMLVITDDGRNYQLILLSIAEKGAYERGVYLFTLLYIHKTNSWMVWKMPGKIALET
jgi:hypothetical protein